MRLLGDNLPASAVYQYVHEADGTPRFLYFSAGIEGLCGVKVDDVLRDAATFHRLVLPDYFAALMKAESASMQDLSVLDMEVQMRRTDGEVRWMHLRSRPRRMPDGRVVWDGVQTDITERKLAEQQLIAAMAAAEQANRTKDHFLAVLSHELRTPLTPIVMAASMLQDNLNLDPTVRDTLEMIHRNIELEARLIDDLLDVTRIARGKIELQSEPHRAVYGHPTCGRGLPARHRGPPVAFWRGPGPGRALLGRGRRIATTAGLLEPAQERGQVHAPRRLCWHPLSTE